MRPATPPRGLAAVLRPLWRRPLPVTEGVMTVPGITSPVVIRRDRWGVPHARARSVEDLAFAQGFCQGQDRLWQLELFRRVTTGRVAELVGKEGLPIDRLFRTLGVRQVAEREESELDDELRPSMDAFCAGVNAAATTQPKPFELRMLLQRFQPWRPADSLAVSRLLNFGLSTNWEAELFWSDLVEHVGVERASLLMPDYPVENPIATQDRYTGGVGLAEQVDVVRRAIGLAPGAIGSNNWAVSGARSATGTPLLAGDPHMPLTMPAVFHQQGLEIGDRFVRGVAVPGIPGITMGQNNDVAWAATNACADTQDLFVERIEGDCYEFCGKSYPVEKRREVIKVRGRRTPEVLEVRSTRHGPIVNDLLATPSAEPLALQWVALRVSPVSKMIARMHEVASGAEFVAAHADFKGPVLNQVWADRHGSIGFAMVGAVPRRKGECPDLPKPGWTGEFEWDGLIPAHEMPGRIDPESGYILTANNRQVGDDYPHHISSDYFDGARAKRIETLLTSAHDHNLDSFEAMQLDVHSEYGLETARRLSELPSTDAREAHALSALREWNGDMTADSVPAAIYQAFLHRFGRAVATALIGDESLVSRWLGRADNGFITHVSSPWRWQAHLMELWSAHDDAVLGQSWDDLARQALAAGLSDLEELRGPEQREWQWGAIHRVHAEHALGEAHPLLSKLLDRGIECGGAQETINQAAWDPNDPFGVIWAPVWRMVADPVNPERSRWQLFPGNSGHPASDHYDDLIDRWASGATQPMAGEGPWRTLTLRP